MEQSPWEVWFLSRSGNAPHFMESEGSLLCSQETSTCPFPKPDEFCPRRPILFLKDPF
jgi:hypothetical protein